MLSICSATRCCSSHSQISFLGSSLSICPYQKDAYFRSFQEDRILPLMTHHRRVPQAAKSVYSIFESSKYSFHQYNLSAADGEVDFPSISSANIEALQSLESTSTLVSSDSSSFTATASFDDLFARIQDSIGASVNTGENVVTSSLNSINSSLTSITETASEAVDNVWSKVFSNIDQIAGIRLSGLLNDSKDATARLTGVSADVLRRTIVIVEDSIVKGTYFVVDYYGSAKELLPSEIRDAVNVTEERVGQILRPVGTTLHEVLRERDGVPDLRRATRSRYASVTLPEVDSSVRKLLRSGKEIEDSLIAAVIRNLKAVQDRSNVIIMDADGTASKGIARSLSKLGVKRSYLVKGGFNSWVKHDLRIKELKPETTLTVLNEEAEAILEGVSSLQLIGYGVCDERSCFVVAEWEKSLQLIGVVGLLLCYCFRDIRRPSGKTLHVLYSLLLVPVKLGSKAISWAAEKLETNGNGLPTSPSSSDVQNRVLQAAAKHESQPSSETEGTQPPMNENADLSEA
ncbi:Calcium sensing receptor, chloroplastic [Linum perenne]